MGDCVAHLYAVDRMRDRDGTRDLHQLIEALLGGDVDTAEGGATAHSPARCPAAEAAHAHGVTLSARADTTVAFSIGGVNYEIDLTEKHAAEMAEDFAKWESHARRVGGRAQRSSRKSQTSSNAAKIREWAHEKGIEVSETVHDRAREYQTLVRVSVTTGRDTEDGTPGSTARTSMCPTMIAGSPASIASRIIE